MGAFTQVESVVSAPVPNGHENPIGVGNRWPTPLMNSCPVVSLGPRVPSVIIGVHLYRCTCIATLQYRTSSGSVDTQMFRWNIPRWSCRPRRSGSSSACIRANCDRGEQRQILRPFRAGALRGMSSFMQKRSPGISPDDRGIVKVLRIVKTTRPTLSLFGGLVRPGAGRLVSQAVPDRRKLIV